MQNRDPEIRALAAGSLARHENDAAPLIENALAIEPDPKTQMAMAGALWELKDPKGVEHLQGMCENASTPVWVLVGVVQHLSDIGESTSACFDPIVDYAESGTDTSDRRQRILPALTGLFRGGGDPEKAAHIVSMLEAMLTDEAAFVRIQAGDALAQIHSHSSTGALQKAVSQELDPNNRSSLQNDLVRLEKDTAGGQPPLP
jgi:HEAT repeat protein